MSQAEKHRGWIRMRNLSNVKIAIQVFIRFPKRKWEYTTALMTKSLAPLQFTKISKCGSNFAIFSSSEGLVSNLKDFILRGEWKRLPWAKSYMKTQPGLNSFSINTQFFPFSFISKQFFSRPGCAYFSIAKVSLDAKWSWHLTLQLKRMAERWNGSGHAVWSCL